MTIIATQIQMIAVRVPKSLANADTAGRWRVPPVRPAGGPASATSLSSARLPGLLGSSCLAGTFMSVTRGSVARRGMAPVAMTPRAMEMPDEVVPGPKQVRVGLGVRVALARLLHGSRDAACGRRQDLQTAGALQQHRVHDRGGDARPDGDDAVADEEQRAGTAEALGNRSAELGRVDQAHGPFEARDASGEHPRGVRERMQWPPGCGESDCAGRVAVHHAVDVSAGPEDFGVQRILKRRGKRASQRAALKIDEDYVVLGNFVKSPAACL